MQIKKPREKQKRWCSKHRVVHQEDTRYWSCRFPNAPDMKIKEPKTPEGILIKLQKLTKEQYCSDNCLRGEALLDLSTYYDAKFLGMLPEERDENIDPSSETDFGKILYKTEKRGANIGFNTCLAQIKQSMKEGK